MRASIYSRVSDFFRHREAVLWPAGVFLFTTLGTIAAFPPHDFPEAAFVFAVPALVWAMRGCSLRAFAGTLLLAQVVVWVTLLFWLRHVTWAGLGVVAVLVAALHTGWYLLAWRFLAGLVARPVTERVVLLAGLAGAWVVLEWIRTFFLTGFPWLPLAASQWQRPVLLSLAPYTGAYGVSFILILFNLGLAAYFHRSFALYGRGLRRLAPEFMAALAVVVFASFGLFSLTLDQNRKDLLRVGFVQPYIPQTVKWDPAQVRSILDVLAWNSRVVSALDPDLILWPEAVTPLALRGNPQMEQWIEELAAELETPVMLGAVAVEEAGSSSERWINGAFLADPDLGLREVYYGKRKLVPFGEYIPWRWLLGWMEKIVPIGGDFARGDSVRPIQVSINGRWLPVGPLICYEDVFPQLARETVRAGAEVIAVVTNNAWYGEEGGAYQHAAHSVLRAAETRRPVLRAGNGGWSGWIDEYGFIRAVLVDASGSIYFRGGDARTVSRDLRWAGRLTPYVRFGDWFVGLSAALLGLASVLRRLPGSKGKGLRIRPPEAVSSK